MSSRSSRPKEKNLHIAVCEWIRLQWPGVVFTSDMSGLRVSMGLAMQMKKLRSSRGIPDLIILEPRVIDGVQYHALLLELKREDERVWLKDNALTSNEHIAEQAAMLAHLNSKFFFSTFACGLEEAIAIINNYLKRST